MKRVWNSIVTLWQPASIILAGAIIIAGLFAFRIGTLVPGASQVEVAGRTSSQSIQDIINNPINAPYKTARYFVRHMHNSIAAERLVNGAVAVTAVVLFYLVVRHFSSRFATFMATIMFASSSSMLNNGRMATPNILLLMLVALLACGYHLRFNSNRTRSLLITSAVLALSLYVPAIIYFIIAGAVWQFKAVQREQKFPKPIIAAACSLIVLIILAPLAYGLLKQPGLWREYFGISAQFPHMLNFLKSAAAVPYGIFISAPRNPLYRLGRQPLLDVFAAVMLVLGCYTLIKHFRLDRLVLLIAIFVLATLYTAISGNYENNFILVPFVYFCIAIGIGTMLELWRKVFPHNPLAQSLSYGIIAVAVLISVNFQTRRYFIAWPHNPEIRAVFTLK